MEHVNWAADIADYDKVHTQILNMADMLTAGIVAQLPDKFSGCRTGRQPCGLPTVAPAFPLRFPQLVGRSQR
jgi:hypothetical protein